MIDNSECMLPGSRQEGKRSAPYCLPLLLLRYYRASLTLLATGLQVLLAGSKRRSHAGVLIVHHDPAWQGYCSACLVAHALAARRSFSPSAKKK